MQQIIESQQFSPEYLASLFQKADAIKILLRSKDGKGLLRKQLSHKMAMIIFAEPSTRTCISFQVACTLLGMDCIVSDNAAEMSSLIKGETMEHMIYVLCEYEADVIILRQKQEGLMPTIAEICSRSGVGLINAGDGTAQHPTQALLDMYTILNCRGRLNNLKVVIGGDLLRGRTVHSLAYLLGKYQGNQISFVSPKELAVPKEILEYLNRHDVSYLVTQRLSDVPKHWADVLYWTRIQSERSATDEIRVRLEEASKSFVIGLRELDVLAPGPNSIIMHPLPVKDEILREVERDPRAVYLNKQVRNGLLIRIALLCEMFGIELPKVKAE